LEGTKDFIYKNCSDRISHEINARKLSHRSIYKHEPKMIGRICRCIITEKRNPYLVQDSVLYALKEALDFKSYWEILWGTEEEIINHLPVLFLTILADLANDDLYKGTINHILCSYLPYARYYGYYKIYFEHEPLLPDFDNSYFFSIFGSDLLSSIDNAFSNAVAHLFNKCDLEFRDAYLDFAKTHNSFKRWPYRFEEWIDATLMPILKQFEPSDSSFSTRILNLIEADFSKIPLLRLTNDPYELNAIKELLTSTDQYISSLEKLSLSYPDIRFD